MCAEQVKLNSLFRRVIKQNLKWKVTVSPQSLSLFISARRSGDGGVVNVAFVCFTFIEGRSRRMKRPHLSSYHYHYYSPHPVSGTLVGDNGSLLCTHVLAVDGGLH